MDKNKWVSRKIKKLMDEGKSQQQAVAIALSMANKKKAQQGILQKPDANTFDYSLNFPQTNPTFDIMDIPNLGYNVTGQDITMSKSKIKKVLKTAQETPKVAPTYEDFMKLQIMNPYTGMSMDNALFALGQSLGYEGDKKGWNALRGAGSAGKILFGGARSLLSGLSTEQENQRVYNDMMKKLFEDNRQQTSLQQGGTVTNADLLTGKFIVDQGSGNVNVEEGEYVKNDETGQLQEVVGDSHKEGGVDINLNKGRVLSDYTKIPPKTAKQLREKYGIKLTKKDTFATALDKYNNKIGLTKVVDEQADLIKKLGKTQTVEDKNTKALNEDVLGDKIAQKEVEKEELSVQSKAMFDELFKMQEAIPKKGKPGEILDEKGNPIAEQGGDVVEMLAKKHGISLERARELSMMQQGGEMTNPMQEVVQMIAEMLSQGTPPEQVLQQLVQQGIPQDQAQQLIEGIMQQMQQPPQMKEGGEYMYQQGGGFDFTTRYTPTISGFDVTGRGITQEDMLRGVEEMQPYTQKGYGAQMRPVEDTIALHSWYFNTEEKKNAFREASKKQGEQPEIKAFQEAYNQELTKRAKEAGLPDSEITNIVNQVGFTGKGVQQFDGKFGAFTSTRPLFDFKKTEQGVQVEEKQTPATERRSIVKTVMPNFPVDYNLPPSSLQAIYKPSINLQEAEALKLTPESALAEMERQRLAQVEQVNQSGLPPQVAQALMASGLATTQASSNDIIAKIEQMNQQNAQQVQQFNIGQNAKEDITNEQFSIDYQNKMMQALANTERDLRNFFIQNNLTQRQNFNDVRDLNLLNASYDQFQTDGQNIYFVNPAKINMPMDTTGIDYDKLTPQQAEALKKLSIYNSKLKNS
jgi:hypothetical protein